MSTKITLCVIDDIKSVVDGISIHIPWEQYDVEVIGTALDGEEGLQLVRKMKPDIVLTDIRMPNMDGIEMLTLLREEAYDGKVIFFSGYNDFEYVQQAVKLGAFDYLTKPHSVKEIIQIILKAKEEIKAKQREHSRVEEIQQKLKESLPVLRQEFFNLLLHHKSNPHNVRKRWGFLQIDLEQTDLSVMAIEIDQFAENSLTLSVEEVEIIRFSLQNIVEETIASYTKGIIFRDTISRFVVIYYNPYSIEDTRIGEKCCSNIAAHTKFTVTIGQGRTVKHVTDLSEAYREAIFALSYQFYTGGNVVLMYDDVANNDRTLPRYTKDKEQELAKSLRSGNSNRALEVVTYIFDELSTGSTLPDPMMLVSAYYELAAFIVRVLLEKVSYSEIEALERKLHDRQWLALVPLRELQQLLTDICIKGCELIESQQRSETEQTVEAAILYIRSHLHTELTVSECAKQVHLSANYFANLFKKITGRTFVQFVTQERVEQAKILLLEGKQVQEIAAAVGYEDRRYFSDVFKKATGMTPSEYKESHLKDARFISRLPE